MLEVRRRPWLVSSPWVIFFRGTHQEAPTQRPQRQDTDKAESPLRTISLYNHNWRPWKSWEAKTKFATWCAARSLHIHLLSHESVCSSQDNRNRQAQKEIIKSRSYISFKLINNMFESRLGWCLMQWGNLLVPIPSSPSSWFCDTQVLQSHGQHQRAVASMQGLK